jgi:hypothetical protein
MRVGDGEQRPFRVFFAVSAVAAGTSSRFCSAGTGASSGGGGTCTDSGGSAGGRLVVTKIYGSGDADSTVSNTATTTTATVTIGTDCLAHTADTKESLFTRMPVGAPRAVPCYYYALLNDRFVVVASVVVCCRY